MTKNQDTIQRAYGNIPKEIGNPLDLFDWVPTPRGVKYYWLLLIRKFTR